jgi:hypothetical protein
LGVHALLLFRGSTDKRECTGTFAIKALKYEKLTPNV